MEYTGNISEGETDYASIKDGENELTGLDSDGAYDVRYKAKPGIKFAGTPQRIVFEEDTVAPLVPNVMINANGTLTFTTIDFDGSGACIYSY